MSTEQRKDALQDWARRWDALQDAFFDEYGEDREGVSLEDYDDAAYELRAELPDLIAGREHLLDHAHELADRLTKTAASLCELRDGVWEGEEGVKALIASIYVTLAEAGPPQHQTK